MLNISQQFRNITVNVRLQFPAFSVISPSPKAKNSHTKPTTTESRQLIRTSFIGRQKTSKPRPKIFFVATRNKSKKQGKKAHNVNNRCQNKQNCRPVSRQSTAVCMIFSPATLAFFFSVWYNVNSILKRRREYAKQKIQAEI